MKVPRKIILLTWVLMAISLVAAGVCYAVADDARKEVIRLLGDTDTELARFIDRVVAHNPPHDDATKARINELLEADWAKVKVLSSTQRASDRLFNSAIAIALVCFVLSVVFEVITRRSKNPVSVN